MTALVGRPLVSRVVAVLLAGCSQTPRTELGPSDAAEAPHTELRPNDAGVTKRIGESCKPEDGWQYLYPPGWPTQATTTDAGVIILPPLPPDIREAHQLEPGIGYCKTGLDLYPDGFFTSNCRTDADCPRGAACDGSMCNIACARDSDCRPGLRCPPATATMFCRQGCPLSMPAPAYGCYNYQGPRTCDYPANGSSPGVTCRCVPRPMNSAEWECAAR